jgi:hypothetical protein
MDISRIDTAIGFISLAAIAAIFAFSALASPLGALSLPCITMLTSFIYFYLMPVVALVSGDEGYFGMYIGNLCWMHTAVLLYALGAAAAFAAQRRVLNANPALSYHWDRNLNKRAFQALWLAAIAGNFVLWARGQLNITGDASYQLTEEGLTQIAFLTQSTNLLVPLTLVLLIRERFGWRSLLVLAVVLFVFLQAGFRFRIMILLTATSVAFALQRGIKIGMLRGALGFAIALPLVIALGVVRRYGQGIDTSALNKETFDAMSGSFGGEFSLVYVLDYLTAHPLPPPSPFEPWLVGIARLVPSFLWADKPVATYLSHFIAGATTPGAEAAGTAAPQQAEILLQMGWWGLFPLAFVYFSIAGWLAKRLAYRGLEVRLAGCALIPPFFGFYMQTRGYFFQVFADGLFILAPLFLLNIGMKRGSAFVQPRPRQQLYAPMRPRR